MTARAQGRRTSVTTSCSLMHVLVLCSVCKCAHRARELEKRRTARTPTNAGRYSRGRFLFEKLL